MTLKDFKSNLDKNIYFVFGSDIIEMKKVTPVWTLNDVISR